jgi:hypothetical protein
MVPDVPGMGALDMNTAEDSIVNNTREVGVFWKGQGQEKGAASLRAHECWGGRIQLECPSNRPLL